MKPQILFLPLNLGYSQKNDHETIFYLLCMYRFGIGEPNYDEFTLAKSFVFAFCSLTMRRWNDVPHNLSTKIIFFTYVQNCIANYFVTF